MNTDPSAGDHDRAVARHLDEDLQGSQLGAYFRTRALQWMHDHPSPSTGETSTAWPTSAQAEEVRKRLGGDFQISWDANEDAVRTIDAFMLAHHAGESLLRHCFAIEDANQSGSSTWQALAGLQGASEFRKRATAVRKASNAELDDLVTLLWLPHELTAAMRRLNPDADVYAGPIEERVRTFCVQWLKHFARFHLESAPGYNAAKHGLSVVSGHARLTLASEDDELNWDDPFLQGPQIRTLEYDWRDSARQWRRMSRWVDPPGLIAWTLLASELLDWLRAVERSRRTGEPAAIRVAAGPLPSETTHGYETAWGNMRADVDLLPRPSGVRPPGA